MHRWSLAVLALLPACGSETPTAPVDAAPGCDAPSEVGLPDGRCIRPGTPAEACAPGFAHDGEYRCEPILPAEPCPPGQMAVPGDEVCHPVMECGTGRWGDLPVDDLTVYVDASYAGADSDGSEAKPWVAINDAVAAAPIGAFVAVAEGVYTENVVIRNKPLRLWGVCPERVTIQAPDVVTACFPSAVCILSGADGSQVGGLTLTGAGLGFALSGSHDVLVDRVWLHDNAVRGVNVDGSQVPTSLALRRSLVEQNMEIGLFASNARVDVEESVVRTTQPSGSVAGWGIALQPPCLETALGLDCDNSKPAIGSLIRSVVEQNRETALFVSGSEALIEGSVVRHTGPSADNLAGVGITTQASCTPGMGALVCDPQARSTLTVRGSLVDANFDRGISVMGSDATVETTLIRGTQATVAEGRFGYGFIGQTVCVDTPTGKQCDPSTRSNAIVRNSVIEHNSGAGLIVSGSDLLVEGTHVGPGLLIESPFQSNNGIGVQPPCQDTPEGGKTCDATARSFAVVRDSLVEGRLGIGINVTTSDLVMETTAVRDIAPWQAIFGDGISVGTLFGPASASFTAVTVDQTARAGIASFGADVTLADTRIRCAAFPLAAEAFAGIDAVIVDAGNNLCGCPDATDPCKAISAGITPPEPPADP